MKSALEIALEKTKDIKPEAAEYIPEELKAKIRDVNKEFDAKIAESETMFKQRLKELAEQYGARELEAHMPSFLAQVKQQKDAINEERRIAINGILEQNRKS